jgi:hypothetical protein
MASSLLSIGALAAAGLAVVFVGTRCELWSDEDLVHVAPFSNRRYKVCGLLRDSSHAFAVGVSAPATPRHCRLGHEGQ